MQDRFKFRAWCLKTVDKMYEYSFAERDKKFDPTEPKELGDDWDDWYEYRESFWQDCVNEWLRSNPSEEGRYTKTYVMDYNQIGLYGDNRLLVRQELEVKHLMQCTGLKDDQKNLIYEGDLISACNAIIKVEWGCKFGIGWITKTVKESRWMRKNDTGNLDGDMGRVIGNIYENPELLER